ncbi:fimbrial protein [Vibrio scophthalmi]|uniref:K88 fimbrial protein A n=1 Tax=Vibrio scophthalmi TaxID=45658 RepID=A0A1E3WIE7_9VIBR|nr:type 1 fimbrial protein [Vibrio scophthalmi]ODS05578.1 K88 fimbrial protein A [Vibrio scophthalmi]
MRSVIFFVLVITSNAVSAESSLLQTTVSIDGVVVASACSVAVDNGVSRSGVVDFGLYNTATRHGNVEKQFQIKLYEQGATEAGCSAFLAGTKLVTFTFGDKAAGQLDERGVVTSGAGGGIRIAITSTDAGKVSSTQVVNSAMPELAYPRDFASQGVFGFNARAVGLESASPGSYHGSLSLVVSYQ